MEVKKTKLFCQIAKDILGKEIINYNRSGKVDEINNPEYQETSRDYGYLFLIDDFFFGRLFYDFDVDNNGLSLIATSDNSTLKSYIELVKRNISNLRYKDNIKNIDYYIDKIEPFVDKNIYKKTKIEVIKIEKPVEEDPIKFDNPFDKPIHEIKKSKYRSEDLFDLKILFRLLKQPLESVRIRDFNILIHQLRSVSFNNYIVNNIFIDDLLEIFSLNEYFFNSCNFNCTNFYKINNKKITISNSNIDLDVFNNTNNEYRFINCNITSSNFISFKSKKIEFKDCKIDFHSISLKSNLSNVESLEIDIPDNIDMKDISRTFRNVKQLIIRNGVDNFDSITSLSNLDYYMIGDKVTLYDVFYHTLDDIERKQIETNCKHEIEIEKIKRNSNFLDDLTLCEFQKERFLRLCKFNNIITIENNRLNILKKYSSPELYIKSNDFMKLNDGQYLYNGKLILNRQLLQKSDLLDRSDFKVYDVYKSFLIRHYINPKSKEIFEGIGPLILNQDGRPIIMMPYRHKYIDTIDQARDYAKRHPYAQETINSDDFFLEGIINYIINNIPPYPISVSVWADTMQEIESVGIFSCGMYEPTIKKLKELYGNKLECLYNKLEEYQDIKRKNQDVEIAYDRKENEIVCQVFKNYNFLTNSEKFKILSLISRDIISERRTSILGKALDKYNIQIDKNVDLKSLTDKCNYDFDSNINYFINMDRFQDTSQNEIMIDEEIIDTLNSLKPKILKK